MRAYPPPLGFEQSNWALRLTAFIPLSLLTVGSAFLLVALAVHNLPPDDPADLSGNLLILSPLALTVTADLVACQYLLFSRRPRRLWIRTCILGLPVVPNLILPWLCIYFAAILPDSGPAIAAFAIAGILALIYLSSVIALWIISRPPRPPPQIRAFPIVTDRGPKG